MPISSLPIPPTRQDPTNFADRADTFLAALPTFATEANALQTDVNAKQAAAAVSETNAQAAATAAQASAGVTLWNAGTTYTQGQTVYSPTTFYTYRRKLAGQTATDPASDSTNWSQVTGTGNTNSESSVVNFTGATGVNLSNAAARLGIGTTSPIGKLDVYNAGDCWASVRAGAGFTASLNICGNANGAFVSSFDLQQSTSGAAYLLNRANSPVIISTNNVERVRISETGNVGIGSTNPAVALHILRTTGTAELRVANSGTTGTDYARLNVERASGASGEMIVTSSILYLGTATSHGVGFRVNSIEVARFDTAGSLGINISSPSSKLHVNGSFALSAPTITSATTYTVGVNDTTVRFNAACTVTLPVASSSLGRIIKFVTVGANAINAVSSANGAVVPLTSATGGTVILPATSGKCITLQSDGTNWIAIAGN